MRKQIRIQKKARRSDEPQTDVKIPREINPRTKKKLADSAEVEKILDELLKEAAVSLKKAAVKIKEAERLIQPFRYLPRVPNCEGRMIDLR